MQTPGRFKTSAGESALTLWPRSPELYAAFRGHFCAPARCCRRETTPSTVDIPKIPLNVPSVGIISSLEAAVAQPGKSDRKVCFYL